MTEAVPNHHEELFESTYQEILAELSKARFTHKALNEVPSWLGQVIEYTLKGGKRHRALSLVVAYERLAPPQAQGDSHRMAYILGWCIELLQAYFLILDDIMDNSLTRRGQLCWYRKDGVGMGAINDAIMLNNCIYQLLHQHLASHPSYRAMGDLFTEVTRFTAYGQSLDLLSSSLNSKLDLAKFTDDRYDAIVLYKTAYYTFSLPIRLAMYLAAIDAPEAHQQAEKILLQMGHLFQVQDDALDCFGDARVTGKIGTDIEEGKCTWLIVKALQRANERQREEIRAHYGVPSEDSVDKIKTLYRELDMEGHFRAFEREQFKKIDTLIRQLDEPLLVKEVFSHLLTLTYQREK